jgi:glycosyltransferase involved in cell wall biosynthesis/predicted O-methyltransferase YrrM
MKLSVTIPAFNSAGYIENLLRAVREFADEVVIGVDSSSSDATEQICSRYADKLFRLEPIGSSERAIAWINEQCTGDWIFRLDDDEMPSTGLVRALPRLLGEREYTHYALPRRWIIGDGLKWISQHPWWPDWQIRLFRNIRSLLSYPGHLHSECLVQGAGSYVTEGSLYHYTLVYHGESRRHEKLQRYEQISPRNSRRHYYFPLDTVATRPIPIDDEPLSINSRSNWLGITGRRQQRRFRIGFRAPLSVPRYVSLKEMDDAKRQTSNYPPEMFLAALECLHCPEVTGPGRLFPVELRVRNDSPFIWGNQIHLSYHLLNAAGEVYEYEGFRTVLPRNLRSGDAIKVIAQVEAPWEQGDYTIKWDPTIEPVCWFSTQGWRGPDTKFRVRFGPDMPPEVETFASYLQISRRIHGWFRHEEAEALAWASYSLAGEPVIVEIGSFVGSSSILLAGPRKVRGTGKVYCIDPYDCSGDDVSVPVYRRLLASLGARSVRQHFEDNMRAANLSEWVEVRQGVAREIAKNWTWPIDLLVLDGDQSREGARAAYDSWSPFLKPGGIIALHNSNDRVYADDHDGHRRLVVEKIVGPKYKEIELIGTTTFALKAS